MGAVGVGSLSSRTSRHAWRAEGDGRVDAIASFSSSHHFCSLFSQGSLGYINLALSEVTSFNGGGESEFLRLLGKVVTTGEEARGRGRNELFHFGAASSPSVVFVSPRPLSSLARLAFVVNFSLQGRRMRKEEGEDGCVVSGCLRTYGSLRQFSQTIYWG
jgi:hypothetical protein